MIKSGTRPTDKVIDVRARDRVKREVKAFIDRLGLEWFLEGDGEHVSFRVKERSLELCAMWLCNEKELVEVNSREGEIDFHLKIKNTDELEKNKRMVRREVLRYVKEALER